MDSLIDPFDTPIRLRMSWRALDHLTFQPEVLKFLDDKVNKVIIQQHPMTNIIMRMVGEFATIVRL